MGESGRECLIKMIMFEVQGMLEDERLFLKESMESGLTEFQNACQLTMGRRKSRVFLATACLMRDQFVECYQNAGEAETSGNADFALSSLQSIEQAMQVLAELVREDPIHSNYVRLHERMRDLTRQMEKYCARKWKWVIQGVEK